MKTSKTIKIQKSENCGNSPKAKFVEDLFIQIVLNEFNYLMELVEEQLEVVLPKGKIIFIDRENPQSIINLEKLSIKKLSITHVVHHGKSGCVYATSQSSTGQKESGICAIFDFGTPSMKKLRKVILLIN